MGYSWIIYGILASSVEKHGFIASGNGCQWWFMLKNIFRMDLLEYFSGGIDGWDSYMG